MPETGVVKAEPHPDLKAEVDAFEFAQRQAKVLCASSLVPDSYKGTQNLPNCLIAMNIAKRLRVDVLTVMQSMVPIHGRPAWSASFVLAMINQSGRFGAVRYVTKDLGKKTVDYHWWEGDKGSRKKLTGKIEIQDKSVRVVTTDQQGNTIEGPEVTVEMAVKDGWFTRSDSKWQTMPELMLRYRAIAFFARTTVPELLVGLPVEGELEDMPAPQQQYSPESKRPQLKPEVDIQPADEPSPAEIEAAAAAEQTTIEELLKS
jgi:hypothetical protein